MGKRLTAVTSALVQGVYVGWLGSTFLSCLSCRDSDTSRARADARARARDLIVITIDTLRADRVGVNGGPPGVTPGLDAIGRGGAVFLDATAHAPLTLPSHSSIFTGRYPLSHGVPDNGR